jgi:hypothetical protein
MANPDLSADSRPLHYGHINRVEKAIKNAIKRLILAQFRTPGQPNAPAHSLKLGCPPRSVQMSVYSCFVSAVLVLVVLFLVKLVANTASLFFSPTLQSFADATKLPDHLGEFLACLQRVTALTGFPSCFQPVLPCYLWGTDLLTYLR